MSFKAVYVCRRANLLGIDADGNSYKYQAGDIIPNAKEWPTFRSLVKNAWIEQEEIETVEIQQILEKQFGAPKKKTPAKTDKKEKGKKADKKTVELPVEEEAQTTEPKGEVVDVDI